MSVNFSFSSEKACKLFCIAKQIAYCCLKTGNSASVENPSFDLKIEANFCSLFVRPMRIEWLTLDGVTRNFRSRLRCVFELSRGRIAIHLLLTDLDENFEFLITFHFVTTEKGVLNTQ